MPLTESEVDIDESLDERAGFFTHYVLNVSWCPTSCMCIYNVMLLQQLCYPHLFPLYTVGSELVSHYVVTRGPSGNPNDGFCGRKITVIVDAVSCILCLHPIDY